MKRLLLLAMFIVAQSFIPAAMAQEYTDWKITHPKPQPNGIRKHKMFDASNWVAIGANGLFMRTSDAGANWYFHNQAGKPANTALTIGGNTDMWFFNANNGFVVGDRGYVGKTTNGGTTFDSVANGLIPVSQRAQSIWFADANTGYVAAGSPSGFNGTIIKTTDGGLNWTSVYTTTATTVSVVGGTSAGAVYAVLADGGVMKTTDGGTTWSTPAPNTVGVFMYDIAFLDANTGFVVGSQGGMSKTTNAGATWAPLTSPQVDWAYYQMKIVSATEIYAVGDAGFLYKSTNLGTSWITLPILPITGVTETLEWFSLEKQGTLYTLVGTFGIIAKSTDGAATWSSTHAQLTTALRFDIQVVPGTRNVVAVGRQASVGTKSVFYSSNAGNSWTSIDIGVNTDLNAISMVNSQIGYACGTNSQVVKTTNGGLTWAAVTRPHATNYTLQAIEFVDANTGWVFVNFSAVTGGNIFKTTDGGTTWTQQTTGTGEAIANADMVDANVGYFCMNSSGRPIYKTTNGGTTWTAVTVPFTGQIRDVDAVDANNVYIVTTAGTNRVAKTTDGGTTWTQITLPITVDCNSVDFRDVNNGYLTGNTTTVVCKTTNAGATWSFQNVHQNTLVKVYAGPGDTTWALGTFSSILRWAGTPPAQAVTKTIGGTTPDYPTIKSAIQAINAQGVPTGGVTYLIRSGTYNEDSLRIRTSTSNPSAPIMFRPDVGATVVVNVTPPSTTYNFAWSVDTTNAVTISGIPVGGTATDRNLTINALGTNGQVGIRALGNSDNLTVKNVVISCGGLLTSTAVRGVDIRYISATQIPDSSMVDYVYVKRAGVGIRLEGFISTNPAIRSWIQNCSIGTGVLDSIGVNGINVSFTQSPVVRNNVIRNIYGTGAVSGIAFGSSSHAAQVYNNSVATVRTTGTGSAVTGIQFSGTQDLSGNKLYNNFISDLAGVATGTGAIYGISISSGAPIVSDTIYFNSINLAGTGTGLRISAALGLVYFGGTPSVVLRNNIFTNTRSEGLGVNSFAAAIYKSTPANIINSDYNDLYVSPTPDTTRATAVYFIATNSYSKYATLGDFRFATGLDNNSLAENPSFVSATDLHLNPATPTPLESAGTRVSVTTDIDEQARNATTPDIGADEGTFTFVDVVPPVIAHTPLPPAASTGGRVASATITDRSGLATTTGGPRLWHKNSTDPTYTAAAVDSVRGTTYYFTIPGRATGTTVQYYLAAQDLAPANNIGTWPPGGSGINPPGSTAPSRFFSYLVQAPLAAGSYTVGVGGNFPTLDSAFRKLSVDGIAGAVTLNLIDSAYAIPGRPRRIIKENAPEYVEVNGKKEMQTQIYPYEYEQEDAPTISLQTLAGPIIGAGPSSRVTIRPAAGRAVRLVGTGTYLLRLLDASYITIDGINTGGASLAMRNPSGSALVVEGNSDNNIVQNVSFSAASGVGGVVVGLQNTSADKTPDLNLIQNNTITKGWVGIAINGNQSSGYATGNRITSNLVKYTEADSLNQIGIFFQNAAGTLIDNNEISRMRNFVTIGTPTGITGQGRHRNTRIWNNVINDIIHINSFDVSAAYGINMTATAGESTAAVIYNNFISGIDDQTVGNGRGSRGISFTQGLNDTIAYNTVYLSGSDGFLSAALYNNFTSSFASRVWRNNIAINARVPSFTNSRTYAFVQEDATGRISSNYNDLYVPSNNNSFIASEFTTATTNYRTLVDWQTTGRDLNSVSVPVNFRGDLHVDSTIVTSINNAGTPIAGITTDIDGQTRSASTPDIGADEFGGIALTRDIGVADVQEVAPLTAAFDNSRAGNSEDRLSVDIATDATTSSNVQVEGARVQGLSGDGLLFEALADTIRFRAFVRNYSTQPETTYQVRWSLDGAVQATVNNPRILALGRIDTVVLQWNNATPGAHLLKAWTLLAADLNRVNDTTSKTIIGPATVPAGIYNNGPVITSRVSASGVAAPAGFRWSELQAVGNEANNITGFGDGLYSTARFRLADDFIVPTGQTWRVDSLVTYSFESSNQGYTTPFTAANIRIWRGAPDSAGSTVVFGDTLANRLTTSYNSRIYRIGNSTTPAPGVVPDFSRVLYQNTLSAGVTLVPGRYFIDWQTFTELNPLNSHFAPTVTIPNRRGNTAWNARQRATNGVWSNALDTGNPSTAPDSTQDFPFVLIGATGPVPAHDIGVASAAQLPSADTVRFRATVWNFGASAETTYTVRWSIDGTVQTTIPNTRILAVGGIDTVQLNWAAATPGNHTLRAWTLLGTDANRTNDTVTVRFTVSAGWTFNNSGTGNLFNSVKAVDRNIGWVGGNNATVLRTLDGGTTWLSRSTTSISGDVYAIEAVNDSLAFVTTTPSGSATGIYRTTNAGTAWTRVFSLAGGFIDAIKMYNATTGIALGDPVGGKWTILKTTNGGAAWTRIATEPTAIAGQAGLNNSLATFDTTHIWFGTTAGTVYRSTDAGLTWNVSPTSFTGQVDEVAFNGPLFGVAGGQDAASRTTNGGATWTAVSIGGTGYVLGLAATGSSDFWAAMGDNVYRSTNRGANWSVSYTGTIGTLRHLDFAVIGSTTRGWTVSDRGGIAAGLLTITGVDGETDKGIPTSFALDQNYPNPFNPTTTIKFALPQNASVTLKIYNLLGQEVATLIDESKPAGFYNMQWSGHNKYGSNVATGVYFYRIEAKPADGGSPFMSLKKMILMK